MAPGARKLLWGATEAEHLGELPAQLDLDQGRDRGRLPGDVVGVVEHRSDISDERRKGDVGRHMPDIAGGEEGDVRFQLTQERKEFSLESSHELLMGLPLLVLRSDGGAIFRMEVSPPEYIIPIDFA
jgi:hypothetical protein